MKLTVLAMCAIVTSVLLCGDTALCQYPWTKYSGNPVMDLGANGTWDHASVYSSAVIYRDSTYHNWYVGFDGTGTFNFNRTGYAHSTDGVSWTRLPHPVLNVGSSSAWDYFDSESGTVLFDESQYKMWYSGYKSSSFACQIGFATAPNETSWTKHSSPVLTTGPGSWDGNAVMWPIVLPSASGGYRMWYTGWDGSKLSNGYFQHYQIGYATSTDDTTWTKYSSNPILKGGNPGEWDDSGVWTAYVLYDSVHNKYHMFYSGSQGDPGTQGIGYAWSTDGIAWTKYAYNPILKAGPPGSWDGGGVITGGVVLVGKTFHMWYCGIDNLSRVRVGYATSPLTAIREGEFQNVPSTFALDQNYPNPFNPSTTIRYELGKASMVRLSVFDMLGRVVSVLVSERKNPGAYEVRFDGSNLASGVYLCRLQTESFVQTRRMLMIR